MLTLNSNPSRDGLARLFLEVACPPHPHQNWRGVTIGQGWLDMRTALVLISSAPRDWANVFAPSNGIYERYGYSVKQHRWAYEIEPANIRARICCGQLQVEL